MLSVIMVKVSYKLSMLNVTLLSVVMMSVVAPQWHLQKSFIKPVKGFEKFYKIRNKNWTRRIFSQSHKQRECNIQRNQVIVSFDENDSNFHFCVNFLSFFSRKFWEKVTTKDKFGDMNSNFIKSQKERKNNWWPAFYGNVPIYQFFNLGL